MYKTPRARGSQQSNPPALGVWGNSCDWRIASGVIPLPQGCKKLLGPKNFQSFSLRGFLTPLGQGYSSAVILWCWGFPHTPGVGDHPCDDSVALGIFFHPRVLGVIAAMIPRV